MDYDEPLNGIEQSVALKEALAHSPAAKPLITTISFYHPTFRGEDGKPSALYCTNRRGPPFVARLEADAPLHAGEEVEFQFAPFEYVKPKESDDAKSPDVKVKVINMKREIVEHLRHAVRGDSEIRMIVRSYYESNISAPHEMPPPCFDIGPMSIDRDTITATAGFGFLVNQVFPRGTYSNDRFPNLASNGG